MTRIVWSPQSLLDLKSIRDYIAHDSPRYAELVVRRLVAAVERLEAFPQSGRIVPEQNAEDIREIIVRPYRIVYRMRPGLVEIVTVFRASRLFPDIR
ncbi:MAG: type II toxin-antitoxin system RelE/ParE family toxin [Acidobacteria bacterium]|nr:MAG: type II toxin-antitoxin system RelE/ParE family toxin [Acidobacteriota bacterium]